MLNITKDELIKLYYELGNAQKIQELFSLTKGQYGHLVKKTFGTVGELRRIVEEMKIAKCKELIENGIQDTNIYLKELCINNKSSLGTFLKRINLKMSDITHQYPGIKKDVNEDILKNKEFMSYFAGLIASDGTMDPNRHRIRIALHQKDEDILIKLKNNIFLNYSDVKIYTLKEVYRELHITNEKIYNYMINLGIVPRKTVILNLNIDKISDINSFMRGYFDGDGCLTVQGKYLYYQIRYIGNENTMKKFQNILLDNDIKSRLTLDNTDKYSFPFYTLHISGAKDNVMKFFNFIYKNDKSKIHLDRKYNKFKIVY